jgi:hypothetical protein
MKGIGWYIIATIAGLAVYLSEKNPKGELKCNRPVLFL